MIYFNINIRSPWWQDRFENLWARTFSTPWKNKFFEIQLFKDAELFRKEFEWTIKQDHAGMRLELGLIGYKASFNFYDNRHWDYENNRWKTHD
jgi:hypothetical protein